MKDRDFLLWLHERLDYIHNESPRMNYMRKLRCIATAIPADQETPADERGMNNVDELRNKLQITRKVWKKSEE